VDPGAGLDDVDKRKSLTVPELRLLGRPARSQSLSGLPSFLVWGAILSAHLGLVG
jgi:hypothetical protein